MYETMMEQAVTDESYQFALASVKRNEGAAKERETRGHRFCRYADD